MAMSDQSHSSRRHLPYDSRGSIPRNDTGMHPGFFSEDGKYVKVPESTPLHSIINICPQPPRMNDMEKMPNQSCIFMISPFKYDPSCPDREPIPINDGTSYIDLWDEKHVLMPCSGKNIGRDRRCIWPYIQQQLVHLKQKCDHHVAHFEDLQTTVENCVGHRCDMGSLEKLINEIYSNDARSHFMSTVLSNICNLALNVDRTCTRPPPLLRIGSNRSVTMSQRQAASLLACAFFCLFPNRSDYGHQNFQEPNFNGLYQHGLPHKIEKLKCILHYFRRVTEKMPNGVISFRRYALPDAFYPKWYNSKTPLSQMHVSMDKKIEDINCVLQVDFANKYIGGGVLGDGCVQEEIRFTICPEMLVSVLLCEVMEANECIFLIGCERYSSYKGYADQFQFDGNYHDNLPKDNWGRKWCHLVAMDAMCFRHPEVQYDMKYVQRELIKAYTSFRPRQTKVGAETLFGIATGNWGCGVFNGDKQLKAIIQLMAASEAGRPLIYTAYLDKYLFQSFSEVYEYLLHQQSTVGDLYRYLEQYSNRRNSGSLFHYILTTPISSLQS